MCHAALDQGQVPGRRRLLLRCEGEDPYQGQVGMRDSIDGLVAQSERGVGKVRFSYRICSNFSFLPLFSVVRERPWAVPVIRGNTRAVPLVDISGPRERRVLHPESQAPLVDISGSGSRRLLRSGLRAPLVDLSGPGSRRILSGSVEAPLVDISGERSRSVSPVRGAAAGAPVNSPAASSDWPPSGYSGYSYRLSDSSEED